MSAGFNYLDNFSMIELITPNKSHKYVVGIDFGHAETSACICPIEWNIAAECQKIELKDIVLWRNSGEKILVSAISTTEDGEIRIHKDAFKYVKGNNCRIGFKVKPNSIDGNDEKLMIAFMEEVYLRIKQDNPQLTDSNHIVYIARPSGWQDDESKDLYKKMALKAGIKNLAGLMSESRAAIFYAKQPEVNFHTDITNGALVFDLGSSTLDLTYLSKNAGPYDKGENLGSSIIDKVLYEEWILNKHRNLKEFARIHSEYIDPLIFEARKFKETVYSAGRGDRSWQPISIQHVLGAVPEEIKSQLKDVPVITLEVESVEELDGLVDQHANYRSRLCEFLERFKSEVIIDNPIKGVLLVGGASKMYYLPDLISRTLSIPAECVKQENDPNLIVSRGIALLGAKDAITSVLQKDLINTLQTRIPELIDKDKLRENLCDTIFNTIWMRIEQSCNVWRNSDNECDKEKLKDAIVSDLKKLSIDSIEKPCVAKIVGVVNKSCNDLLNEANGIIAYYAPEVQISTKELSLEYVLPKDLLSGIMEKYSCIFCGIVERISNNSFFDLIRHIFGNDDKSRKKMVERLPKEKVLYRDIIKDKMLDELSIENVIKKLNTAMQTLINNKLKEVRIPIE